MAPMIETREELLRSLHGCTLSIPDLTELLSQWPRGMNPEINRLRKAVDEKLEECVSITAVIRLNLPANP